MAKVKIEVRSKAEVGHRRLGRFWGIEPQTVWVSPEDATVLEACTALLCRRLDTSEGVAPRGGQRPAGDKPQGPPSVAPSAGGAPPPVDGEPKP